jgi:hypothetical protein
MKRQKFSREYKLEAFKQVVDSLYGAFHSPKGG